MAQKILYLDRFEEKFLQGAGRKDDDDGRRKIVSLSLFSIIFLVCGVDFREAICENSL